MIEEEKLKQAMLDIYDHLMDIGSLPEKLTKDEVFSLIALIIVYFTDNAEEYSVYISTDNHSRLYV
ncbi:MAG: hypothetical protein ACFE7E_08485 [Candidatus Hodarchaeota archaeon]